MELPFYDAKYIYLSPYFCQIKNTSSLLFLCFSDISCCRGHFKQGRLSLASACNL